jgi:cell division initiation protein
MELTPIDIQQHQFKTKLWGVDAAEVDAFLDVVASAFEETIRSLHAAQQAVREKDAQLQEFRERERTLRDTMVTATRVSEDMKRNARKEAEVIVAAAEEQGKRVVDSAHQTLLAVMDDIQELKRQRAQLEGSFRALLTSTGKLLDTMGERDQFLEESKLALFPKAQREAAASNHAHSGQEITTTQRPRSPDQATEDGRYPRGARR